MSDLIESFIHGVGSGQVDGNLTRSLDTGFYDSPLDPSQPLPDVSDPGANYQVMLEDRDWPGIPAQWTVERLISQPPDGWSAPSLDNFESPSYRDNRPGFGGYNEQPMQSGPANFDKGVVPSEEAGIGKPWGPVAHMPNVVGVNRSRSEYAYQGVFADGMDYPGVTGPQAARAETRSPAWADALFGRGQNPGFKAISQYIGSTIIEDSTQMSLAEVLGQHVERHGPGWGIQ